MKNLVTHTIKDNQLVINNDSYQIIGTSKIIVGVENTEVQEIVKDNNTGLNYSRNAIEAQEIHNRATQLRRNWFYLDLETGANPRRYFPGCEIHGEIRGENIEIKAEASQESETLLVVSNILTKILNVESIEEEPENNWYQIIFNNVTGFVHANLVSNVIYAEPF